MGKSRRNELLSCHFSLRMCTRLLGLSNPIRRSKYYPPPKPMMDSFLRNGGIAGYKRRMRKIWANKFRKLFTLPENDRKTFICSSGTSARMDKSFGYSWVGVQGMESICVVISTKALVDVARLGGFSLSSTNFASSLISYIEDVADSSIESSHTFDLPVKKPFSIVSVMPSTTDVSEAISTTDSNEKAAIKYLQEKMNSGLILTCTETKKIAVDALQHVVNQKLEANDFSMAILDYNDFRLFEVFENEKLLAVMNEPASGSSSAWPMITDTVN